MGGDITTGPTSSLRRIVPIFGLMGASGTFVRLS